MFRTIKRNRNPLFLLLDVVLALSFVVAMEYRFTGIQVHEALGLFFAGAVLVHIVFHWNWVVGVTRTFFKKVLHESRLNYVLNALLFASAAVMTVTGILISRTLGLQVGGSIQALHGQIEGIHRLTSYLSLAIVGLHVGLHWQWIVNVVRKLTIRKPAPAPVHRPLPTATIGAKS